MFFFFTQVAPPRNDIALWVFVGGLAVFLIVFDESRSEGGSVWVVVGDFLETFEKQSYLVLPEAEEDWRHSHLEVESVVELILLHVDLNDHVKVLEDVVVRASLLALFAVVLGSFLLVEGGDSRHQRVELFDLDKMKYEICFIVI